MRKQNKAQRIAEAVNSAIVAQMMITKSDMMIDRAHAADHAAHVVAYWVAFGVKWFVYQQDAIVLLRAEGIPAI